MNRPSVSSFAAIPLPSGSTRIVVTPQLAVGADALLHRLFVAQQVRLQHDLVRHHRRRAGAVAFEPCRLHLQRQVFVARALVRLL